MIKLIVSDFDGTLMPYGQSELRPTVKKRIEELTGKGIAFAVSSGRTYSELLPYFRGLEDRLWFICCDGAYYIRGGRSFYEKKIERTDLELFFKNAGEGFSFILHGAEKNYCVGDIPTSARTFCAQKISSIFEVKEKIFKITSFGREIRLPEYSGLRMHWDGGADRTAQYVNRFCDKGAALSDLQVRLMLTRFDTAAMGDGGNDVAMMKNAKLSIRIGSRSEELAEVCNAAYDSAEEALDALSE
ncbi:MAG: HAD family phosphatase [Clostridia bacterium]|nr:HAD family phosphatase [Clostridia bacterium]